MRYRRCRQDTVSKIPDERPVGKCREYPVYCAIKRIATGQQQQWIKITLDCNASRNMRASKIKVRRPIEPDGIDRDIIQIAKEPGPDPARKSDDSGFWNIVPYRRDQALRGLDAPLPEFLIGQNARPRIENLDGIGARLQLPDPSSDIEALLTALRSEDNI